MTTTTKKARELVEGDRILFPGQPRRPWTVLHARHANSGEYVFLTIHSADVDPLALASTSLTGAGQQVITLSASADVPVVEVEV